MSQSLPRGWKKKKSRRNKNVAYYYNVYTGESTRYIPLNTRTTVSCDSFRGLRNIGNSCYMDSVLVALFAGVSYEYIDHHILFSKLGLRSRDLLECGNTPQEDLAQRKQIQQALIEIVRRMRSRTRTDSQLTCTILRNSLAQCYKSSIHYGFHKYGQEDAGEFLMHLLSMFPTMDADRSIVTYATQSLDKKPNDLVKTHEQHGLHTTIVWPVNPFEFYTYKRGVSTQDMLSKVDDSGELTRDNMYKATEPKPATYRRRIQINTLEDAPYLIINVERTIPGMNVSRKPVTCNETIRLESGTKLALNAVVCHAGTQNSGHYTCYFECQGTWYYYDDISSNVRTIGTYRNLINATDVSSSGTLFFYV